MSITVPFHLKMKEWMQKGYVGKVPLYVISSFSLSHHLNHVVETVANANLLGYIWNLYYYLFAISISFHAANLQHFSDIARVSAEKSIFIGLQGGLLLGDPVFYALAGAACQRDRYLAGIWRQPISNTMLKHQGSRGEPPLNNTPSAWSVRREYLLINDGLRPEGDIVCVALERLAVGHAEQQTGLGIVHGVLA